MSRNPSYNTPPWVYAGDDAHLEIRYMPEGGFEGMWRVRVFDASHRELLTIFIAPEPANDLMMGLSTSAFSGPTTDPSACP